MIIYPTLISYHDYYNQRVLKITLSLPLPTSNNDHPKIFISSSLLPSSLSLFINFARSSTLWSTWLATYLNSIRLLKPLLRGFRYMHQYAKHLHVTVFMHILNCIHVWHDLLKIKGASSVKRPFTNGDHYALYCMVLSYPVLTKPIFVFWFCYVYIHYANMPGIWDYLLYVCGIILSTKI